MTEEQIERILEAACDICRYTQTGSCCEDSIEEICKNCPVEKAVRGAS